ncbi:unnamed protein product [Darwinula stevensoni]|uniref:Uncharacterized protein n=1 Tax=Darwinula stevensoni TaxID=69355 RepID=A0A7R8X552_9CRUS|nr:unnamed protein product [Darwinula stevensoni]CAG0884293.1 unnamed protein product [Darwinula stevensoni]
MPNAMEILAETAPASKDMWLEVVTAKWKLVRTAQFQKIARRMQNALRVNATVPRDTWKNMENAVRLPMLGENCTNTTGCATEYAECAAGTSGNMICNCKNGYVLVGTECSGTSQREVCQVCRVCSLEERLGELSGRLISVEEEIRGIRKEVGEVQRDDLVARLVRVEEALRGFPSLPDFSGRVALSSFDSASSADSQMASNWAQVVKGAKVKRSQEAVIKTENKFLGLREVSLDEGTEGGVGTGVRSAGQAQAVLKGRGKTRALVIVGDSNVRRLEGAMEKDSGAQVSFSQFPGARIEHIRDRIGSVVCSESAEEVSVVLHSQKVDLGVLVRVKKTAKLNILRVMKKVTRGRVVADQDTEKMKKYAVSCSIPSFASCNSRGRILMLHSAWLDNAWQLNTGGGRRGLSGEAIFAIILVVGILASIIGFLVHASIYRPDRILAIKRRLGIVRPITDRVEYDTL